MLMNRIIIGLTLLIFGLDGEAYAVIDETISEHVGKTVVLPCPMDIDTCGPLHSINWFKGDNRIAAVLLDESNITSVTEEYKDRIIVEHSPYELIIKDLQISDEDIYLCDTTFFIPRETCDNYNGYRVELNVLVPPTEVVIIDEKGDRIENGTVLGPLQEQHTLRSTCVVKNTRPQPTVGWFRGNKRLTTHSPTYDEKDGLFTATLELSLVLSRLDLGNTIECRVESSAIEGVIRSEFQIDMQVRPTGMDLSGVEHHTVQGSKVVLTCQVYGARPAVNITWTNSSVPISVEENDLTQIRTQAIEQKDGTFHTMSDLIFSASRFENDMVFRCDADNIVHQEHREKPMNKFVTLEVMYPPVVKVSPNHIIVNTSDTVLLNCEYVANPASLTSVKWYRNSDLVNVSDTDRLEGGNPENVALVIKGTNKEDIGNYTCQLSNTIGKGISETQIELDVQYVPVVEVLMTPEGPVKESDESNVTLYCNIIDANPSTLTKVRWYANSSLLKELPDCTETNEDLCHIDPSKLLLESIGRGFFYNYSCEGFNSAGWGQRSEDKELLVHYEPGPATLTHFPLIAVKKKSVTFSCSVDDPGYPESNRFRWFRGGRGPLQDVVTKDWTVEPVGLDSRTNYSCYAYNDGGHGTPATVTLEVHAPPFFIKNLFPYTGILFSSRNASLMCRIECVPRCTISWYKDGIVLPVDGDRYFVKEEYVTASPATGDFESVMSVLHFNMTAWPNKRFDIELDNANYSCASSANSVGPGIKSATYFSIEYPPENTTVSHEIVHVLEDNIPGRVLCKSKANPEPSYEWRFNNKTITRGNALIINSPMSRNDTGRYTCVAFNKHGSSVADTFIDVQFKPKCEIDRRENDDQDTLICTAFGNPEEADFSWSIKAENDTVELLGSGNIKNEKSYYILDEDYAIARTYRCVANNSVGAGTFCEIEVAEQLAWWQRWDRTTLIILVASVLALLLAVIIICCIIICICRRRRRQDKYHTEVSISATQSVLSYQPTVPLTSPVSQNVLEVPKSPPRWPLRPGVMVHVKNDTKENLTAHRLASKNRSSSGTNASATIFLHGSKKSPIESQIKKCVSTAVPVYHAKTRPYKISLKSYVQSQCTLPCHDDNNSTQHRDTERTNTNRAEDRIQTVPPQLPPRNKCFAKTSINSTNLMANISVNSGTELISNQLPSQTNISQCDETLIRTVQTTELEQANPSQLRIFNMVSIIGNVFKRRNSEDRTRDSQRSHVGLLNSMFTVPKALWKQKDNQNHFTNEHRLKGIRSSGSVTYKKTATTKQKSSVSDSTPIPMLALKSNIDTLKPSNTINVTKQNTQTSANELHDKSSSLADPLTEPGEYENLPFHGLQTAPNKLTSPPSNFNNNANALHVSPRNKILTTNHEISQHLTHHPQREKSKFDVAQYNQSSNNRIKSTRSNAIILDSAKVGIPPLVSSSFDHFHQQHSNNRSGQQTKTYTIHNCFPKSYTEYYHNQQQQKLNKSNRHLLKDVAQDYSHIPEQRGFSIPRTSDAMVINNNSTKPFLAVADLKKFDTTAVCENGARINESIHRTKRSKGINKGKKISQAVMDEEKRFYSLKITGNKKSLHMNLDKPLGTVYNDTARQGIQNKCKRHHSFAGSAICGFTDQSLSATPLQSKMKFYESPVYENLNDSVQIHECQIDAHPMPTVQLKETECPRVDEQVHYLLNFQSMPTKCQRKHLQQKQVEDINLCEPERRSIYRSDSGISNSSYECITPIPAPRSAIVVPGKIEMNCATVANTKAVYMNVMNKSINASEYGRSATSSSVLGHSHLHNEKNPKADTISQPTFYSKYRATNTVSKQNTQGLTETTISQQEATTPEDLSTSTTTPNTSTSDSNRKRSISSCSASLQSLERGSNTTTNQFLATNSSSSSGCDSSTECTIASNHQELRKIDKASSTTKRHSSINYHTPLNTNNSGTEHYERQSSSNGNTCRKELRMQHEISTKRQQYIGYSTRPVRLPLRKHHSFHFQSSQTVAGIRSKTRLQQKAADRSDDKASINLNYPLWVESQQFLNEKSAFKPISPVEPCNRSRFLNSADIHKNDYSFNVEKRTVPRICGTSLKRHVSNVESYGSKGYEEHLQPDPLREIQFPKSDDENESDEHEFDNYSKLYNTECDIFPNTPAEMSTVAYTEDLAISSDSELTLQQRQFLNKEKYQNDNTFHKSKNCRSIDSEMNNSFLVQKG